MAIIKIIKAILIVSHILEKRSNIIEKGHPKELLKQFLQIASQLAPEPEITFAKLFLNGS